MAVYRPWVVAGPPVTSTSRRDWPGNGAYQAGGAPDLAHYANTSVMPSILIVEDEAKMQRLLQLNLSEEGYTIRPASDAESGLNLLRQERVDLVLTDLKLPGMDGLEFLQAVKRINAALPVVLMTAYGTVETAVEAMKAGASDYVLKPFSMEEIKLVIHKELDVNRLREENRALREALGKRYEFANIVARSPKMQEVLAIVERVAPTNSTVLLGGESGAGKDLIARAIHQHSRRASGPFIKINSTAIPENLLESELFGYEKGAFTGAVNSKPGKFELADKGTIFLDEIGDVPPATQVKLLRVLQEREFERLGGTKTLKVDLRLIAATNRDLRAALEEGTFREDLYYRLNVVPISIPPLREHKQDIPDLVNHFVARFAKDSPKAIKGIMPAALRLLMDYHWPGNVRELENIIERAVAFSDGPLIDLHDIRMDLSPSAPSESQAAGASESTGPFPPPGMTLEQFEDEIIHEALRRAQGNKSQAARLLGLSRNAFRYRLDKLGVPDEPEKAGGPGTRAT
jgi:DNA-binding NtrC family response regulator